MSNILLMSRSWGFAPFSSNDLGNAFTIEFKFKCFYGSTRRFLMESTPSYEVSLSVGNEGLFEIFSTSGMFRKSTVRLDDGQEYVLSYVYWRGKQRRVYLDGKLFIEDFDVDNTPKPFDKLVLGSFRDYDDRFFDGTISMCRIWNTALSQSEIVQNQDDIVTEKTNLLADYDFNRPVGSTSIVNRVDSSEVELFGQYKFIKDTAMKEYEFPVKTIEENLIKEYSNTLERGQEQLIIEENTGNMYLTNGNKDYIEITPKNKYLHNGETNIGKIKLFDSIVKYSWIVIEGLTKDNEIITSLIYTKSIKLNQTKINFYENVISFETNESILVDSVNKDIKITAIIGTN